MVECLLSQCHGPTTTVLLRHKSGHSRRNRIQEQLRFCNHASLPRSTYQSGLSLSGRPNNIRHIYNLDMGWRNASRSVFPNANIHDERRTHTRKAWLVTPHRNLSFVPPGCAKGPAYWILCS
ncbi:hypothetical protein TNCV_500421 [Trichonephila clavipes]|nr:hypothetical protein TNCV_500421 [Trichonephila clavipes]